MNDLEHLVYAFYVAGPAADWNMVGRFWPRPEIGRILEDRMKVAVRRFGQKAVDASAAPSTAFAEQVIEQGGFSTQTQKFGGTMHQFQMDTYPKVLAALQAADPVIQASLGKGAEYWDAQFTALTGDPVS